MLVIQSLRLLFLDNPYMILPAPFFDGLAWCIRCRTNSTWLGFSSGPRFVRRRGWTTVGVRLADAMVGPPKRDASLLDLANTRVAKGAGAGKAVADGTTKAGTEADGPSSRRRLVGDGPSAPKLG